MFKPLTLKLQKYIEPLLKREPLPSFYHYYPLIYALSETVESRFTLNLDNISEGIYVNDKELYLQLKNEPIPESIKKVWISTSPKVGFEAELYDVNFIYDLDVTLQVKNFRDNVEKFKKEHQNVFYAEPSDPELGWSVVKEWYLKSGRGEFTDFGYTRWLTLNYAEFEDLHPRVVLVDERPVAFSLWGELGEGLGIHLVCKDIGWPYLQDYTRHMTYSEMKALGFNMCNDGGDAGEDGIRIYKLKMRPKFIAPIYSWVRE